MPLMSALGFWIAQANDLSVSTHPTSWVSGQRWSVTAGQWQSMYDAQTTLLGTRTTERDTARNSLYVSGTYLSGPTWQAQDATDVATLATRTSERDTARNSLYVGGTYQIGNTWQQQNAISQSDLTAMTTSRNSWQTNANTAYDSGTWGSGTPWSSRWTTTEAARVAAVSHQAIVGVNNYDISFSNISIARNTWTTVGTWTAPKSGNWVISWICTTWTRGGTYSSGETAQLQLVCPAGTITGPTGGVPPDGNTALTRQAVYGTTFISNGQVVTFQGRHDSGQGTAGSRAFENNTVTIRFIPEYSYPS